MQWRAAWLALGLAACGRFEFASHDAASDTRSIDSPPGGCDVKTPFVTITPLVDLDVTTAYDSTLTLLPDEKTGYFYSDRAGSEDLFVATRTGVGSPFTVAPLASLNMSSADAEPAISADGQVLVFTSDRPPSGTDSDLWVATQNGGTFGAPTRITSLSTTAREQHPFFQLGTNDFYFASNAPGVLSLYHATHLGNGTFSSATLVSELSPASNNNTAIVVSSDGLAAYFRSDRPGTSGAFDIWLATRALTTDPFGPAVNVSELNSPGTDTPTWLSPDRCRLYFTSDRGSSSDIYVAEH